MPFPFDEYPWAKFEDLNIAYMIQRLGNIISEADAKLQELDEWKTATEQDLENWKNNTMDLIAEWEHDFMEDVHQWEHETEQDLAQWKADTTAALDAWKAVFITQYEALRVETEHIRDVANTAAQEAAASAASAASDAASIASSAAQISENTDNIDDLIYNMDNFTAHFVRFPTDGSSPYPQGITYTVSADGRTYHASGTASNQSRFNKWLYTDGFPLGVGPGTVFLYQFTTGNPSVIRGSVLFRLANNTTQYIDDITENRLFTVPDNAVGMTFGTNIPSGATVDETVGFEMVILSTIENTIRESIDDLEEELDSQELEITGAENRISDLEYNKNVFQNHYYDFPTAGSSPYPQGITYTVSADGKTYHASGTAANQSRFNKWLYTDGFPQGVGPGTVFLYQFTTGNPSVIRGSVLFRLANNTTQYIDDITENRLFTVPDNAVGMTFGTNIPSGATVDETVGFEMVILSTTDQEILNKIASSDAFNSEAHLLCVGSSFLRGSIWPGGIFDHLCSYDNAPWGILATECAVAEENTRFVLRSSTGILYDAGEGNILNTIKGINLSPYDILVTEFNTPDVENYNLGSLSSSANDGTIIGAFLELLNYMKSSNKNAMLIVVGAPPSSPSSAHTGSSVFSGNWSRGYSISDADVMMHKLAKREHFIFIDWEDWKQSYYYRELCYGSNLHPEADSTARSMGLYLARCCSMAKSIMIG